MLSCPAPMRRSTRAISTLSRSTDLDSCWVGPVGTLENSHPERSTSATAGRADLSNISTLDCTYAQWLAHVQLLLSRVAHRDPVLGHVRGNREDSYPVEAEPV